MLYPTVCPRLVQCSPEQCSILISIILSFTSVPVPVFAYWSVCLSACLCVRGLEHESGASYHTALQHDKIRYFSPLTLLMVEGCTVWRRKRQGLFSQRSRGTHHWILREVHPGRHTCTLPIPFDLLEPLSTSSSSILIPPLFVFTLFSFFPTLFNSLFFLLPVYHVMTLQMEFENYQPRGAVLTRTRPPTQIR
jgi:hypothetical protein